MTKTQLRERFRELKKRNDEFLDEQLESALLCGSFELKDYGNDFRLAKIIMTVACINLARQWMPFSNNLIKEVENLRYFI